MAFRIVISESGGNLVFSDEGGSCGQEIAAGVHQVYRKCAVQWKSDQGDIHIKFGPRAGGTNPFKFPNNKAPEKIERFAFQGQWTDALTVKDKDFDPPGLKYFVTLYKGTGYIEDPELDDGGDPPPPPFSPSVPKKKAKKKTKK